MNTILTITCLASLLCSQEGQKVTSKTDASNSRASERPAYLLELTGHRSRFSKDRFQPDGRVLMSSDGSVEQKIDSVIKGALSPDGKRRLIQRGDALYFATAKGESQGMMTKAHSENFDASWSPSGREVVYVAKLNGANRVNLTRLHDSSDLFLSAPEGDASMPRWNPDGTTIAFRYWPKAGRVRTQKNHATEHVLIVDRAGHKVHRLGAGSSVMDIAWSPDGKRIAISSLTTLSIYDSASGKLEQQIKSKEVHPKLFAHGARDMHWRPDGLAIACHINFLGGRTSVRAVKGDGPRFEKIFGDNQVFIIQLDGVASFFDVPENPNGAVYRLSGWAGAQLLGR